MRKTKPVKLAIIDYEPPRELTQDEADEFRRVSAMLQTRFRGFRESDIPGLARLCQLRTLWQRLFDDVNENGVSFAVTDHNGELVQRSRPEVRMLQQFSAEMLRLEKEYGLTPMSHSPELGEPDVIDRVLADSR
ncbi:MAG: P27 family phage terminase small subunit [Planctomycetota bacterium]|nr:P27 family phage terminase small subunit [Planctomycetota bacterium]MDA1213244.1 P27 family phage terminase small subunit [Planctomycetota bacterium]